jgi:ATP-dependent DNA helicase RecG
MALPVNIPDLIHGQTVEWARLEFKQGWNPEEIIHTLCAFANDLHNWGGGYVVVGIAENNGQPVLPPAGLQANQLDKIQGEIVQLAHQISPNYFPIVEPYVLDGAHILVLWCPAGDNRPYSAPTTQGRGAQRANYVRVGSRSVVAQGETLRQLQALAARIPFDDRVNQRATINDLDLGLIQAHLQEVKSALFEQSKTMPFADLCRNMLIAKGADEHLLPVNVGLLFFNAHPDKFFERAWIEVVVHKDLTGKRFYEKKFDGPLQKQLRDALSFIQTNFIHQHVIKVANQAEALRFDNFPFAAIEEALSNAVYHKSYEMPKPIEVQVWPDKIEILSFPGPVPPIDANMLQTQQRFVARDYRNRRIGDFLKELHLTEGRGTGVPGIYRAMVQNGSPPPVLETDEDRNYFLTALIVHPHTKVAESNQVTDPATDLATNGAEAIVFNSLDELFAYANGAGDTVTDIAGDTVTDIVNKEIHPRVKEVLSMLLTPNRRSELFRQMGLSKHTDHRVKYLDPLVKCGWISFSHPDNPTHPNQTYHTTEAGKRILRLLK